MFYLRGVCIAAKEAEELAARLSNEEEDLFQDFWNARRIGLDVAYLVEKIDTADASGKPTIPVFVVFAKFGDASDPGFHFGNYYASYICGVKNSLKEAKDTIRMLEEDEDDSFQHKVATQVLHYELEYTLTAIKTDCTGLVTSTDVPIEEEPKASTNTYADHESGNGSPEMDDEYRWVPNLRAPNSNA